MKPFEIIKNLRKQAGLVQEDIAKILEIRRPSYTNKEKGKNNFSADELILVLGHLKKFLSPEDFQKGFEAIFGHQTALLNTEEHPQDTATPVAIDTATQIITNAMKRTGKTMTPEQIRAAARIIREELSEPDTPENVTRIIREHQNLIQEPGFKDPEAGKEANEYLIELEHLDPEEFYVAITRLKYKVKNLKESKSHVGKEKKAAGES